MMKLQKILTILLLFLVISCSKPEITGITQNEVGKMKITSPAFENNQKIPDKYTCKGENINPLLVFEAVPDAKSLALIMDDPDAPAGIWVHWLLFNMPLIKKIDEDSLPFGTVQGKNSWGKNNYGGPCPPSGTHRYFFKLYALDTTLDLDENADKAAVEQAMQGHIIEKAELIGLASK